MGENIIKNIKLELCEYSESLIARMHELNDIAIKSNCDTVDISFIEKGLVFAKHYHQGQFRKSGEPYVSHPIIVSEMVADNMFRENVIIAALLHDTVEDTTLTLDEIKYEFSPRIAQIVERLTRKVDPITNKKMSAGECLIKAYELGDNDAVLIKLIDRWHNIMTIDSMSNEKQKKISKETMEHFVLFAMNLDLWQISEKLLGHLSILNSLDTSNQETLFEDDYLLFSLGLQNVVRHKKNL